MLVAEKETVYRPRSKKLKILSELIYETIDGRDFYYKGYQEVLKRKKTKEEVMGTSGLQSLIVSYLFEIIALRINKSKYRYLTSETGVHLDYQSNLSNDIAIFDKNTLTADKITTNYIDVSPIIAIEVDVRIDLEKPTDFDYVYKKIEKLLDFGVERVIWVFSNSQKVLVANQNQDWLVVNWDKNIEIIDEITFNLAEYLNHEGIKIVKT